MTENNLLNKFLQEHKTEVADDHFSKRVMKNIPGREKKISSRWTALGTIVGILLFFFLDGFSLLINLVHSLLRSELLMQLEQTDPILLTIVFIILVTLGIKRICSLE